MHTLMGHQPSLSLYNTPILVGDFLWFLFSSRELLWCSGVVIFLLMILTAFLGYITLGSNEFMGSYSDNQLSFYHSVVGETIVFGYGEASAFPSNVTQVFQFHYLFLS